MTSASDRLQIDSWNINYERSRSIELIEKVLYSSGNERLHNIHTLLLFLKERPQLYKKDKSFHTELVHWINHLLDSMMADLSVNYLSSYKKCTQAIELLQDESLKLILQQLIYPLFQEHIERIALYPEIMDCVDAIQENTMT
jgi:hypothetical protein